MLEQDNNQQFTLDDLNYFWTSNGAPCFIANNYDKIDDICEVVESLGFQIYYLITDKMVSKTGTTKNDKGVSVNTQYYEYTPAVLKVVNNIVGRAVMDSKDHFGNDFCPVEEHAIYNMPPIPRIIVDKLDEFFRLVDAQHGTESIVILTYDTTKEGSDGWGVLVPDQTNTAAHCSYNADSIAELKPDDVMIVGSVHSHPHMAAYASGTDHADQADFDGIHITYGWQKSVNNGATQYHIEMQIGGSAYTLKPEDVFEDQTITSADPEVIEWASKVKKALPPTQGGSLVSANQNTQVASYPTTQVGTPVNTRDLYDDSSEDTYINTGFDLTKVEKDAIVGIEYDELRPFPDCLMCTFPLEEKDLQSACCSSCDSPIISSHLSHTEIIELFEAYCIKRNIDPTVAYYLYCTDYASYNSSFLINIKHHGILPSTQPSVVPVEEKQIYDYEFADEKFLLCCDLPIELADQCTCLRTISRKEMWDYDQAHAKADMYDPLSNCKNCHHYYLTSCPSYKQSIIDFINDGSLTVDHSINGCDQYIHYKEKQEIDDYIYEKDYYV